jgi:hypothetical protein
MDYGWIGWGALLLFSFLIGLFIIISAKRFVDWVFRWSIPAQNKINKIFEGDTVSSEKIKGQKELSVWMYRLFGGLICCGAVAMLISAIIANHTK